MTDDQMWRGIITGAVLGVIGVFSGPIKRWLHRIGYRDWRDHSDPK